MQQDVAALDANRGRWRAAAEGAAAPKREGADEEEEEEEEAPVDDETVARLGAGGEVWLAVEAPDAAEGLAGALDVRGNREKELRAALEKVRGARF